MTDRIGPAAPPAATGSAAGAASLGVWLAVLCALYILPGLIGHDPWKQDETYSFGMILHIIQSGDWVIPQVAGEPFMEKPPLYYISAALLAKLFSPWLPLHDGARLASGLYLALALACFAGAARIWLGREGRAAALVLLLGAVGLLVTHLMFTDVALFAGCAVALYGLALASRRPALGGLLLGSGAGIGFMSKGLLLPAALAVTVALLPGLNREFRTRAYLRTLALAAVAASPWMLIWPLALWHRSPDLFMEWFWMNNIGRYVGFAVPKYGAGSAPGYWAEALSWFAFPLLPLGVLALVRSGPAQWRRPPMLVPLVFAAVLIAVLATAGSARALYALPVLLPLALLAAQPQAALPDAWDRAWARGSRLLFGGLAVLVWGVWIYLLLTPQRPWLAPIARALPLDYAARFDPLSIALALAFTAGWLWLRPQLPARVQRGPASWLAGLILLLGLISALWLPWINAAKSYHDMYRAMALRLPARYDCMASEHLGESEKAMLDYFDGIVTRRRELDPGARCELLLVQGRADQVPAMGPQWSLLWQGNRQGDFSERLRLYQRPGAPEAAPLVASRSPRRPEMTIAPPMR